MILNKEKMYLMEKMNWNSINIRRIKLTERAMWIQILNRQTGKTKNLRT